MLQVNTKKSTIRSKSRYSLTEMLKAYVLIAPAIILLAMFIIYPIAYLLKSSLYDGSLLSIDRNFIGLENFKNLFSNVDFFTSLKNTIIYSIGLVCILLVLSTLFAVWVNSGMQKHLNSVALAAAFTPNIVSLVTVSTVFLWIMDPEIGPINYILRSIGAAPFPFLSNSKTALISIILMMVWKSFGYYSLLIIAALQGISKDIYEAASVDDISKIKIFFQITIPMISPTLFFIVIVGTIGSFQIFDPINLMTLGGPVNSTNTLVYLIYSDAFKYLKLGPACAESVVLLAFVGVLTMIYFMAIGRRVHYK